MKTIALLVVVLVVCVASAACGGSNTKITSQNLVSGVEASLDDQKTCRFSISFVGKVSGTISGTNVKIHFKDDATGVLDDINKAKQMEIDRTATVSAAGAKQTVTQSMRQYFLGGTAYIGIQTNGSAEQWSQEALPEGFWDSQSYMGQQSGMLGSAGVKVLGTEKVGGIPCYIAEITIDVDLALKWLHSQFGFAMPNVFNKDSIYNYVLKGWYAQDNFSPMKIQEAFDINYDTGATGVLPGHFTVDTFFYDYNKPVTIQLPPEAN